MSYETESKQETGCGIIVTKICIFPFQDEGLGHILAMSNIVLNDALIIRGLHIMEGENGLFLAYPANPFSKGMDFGPIIVPVTCELRKYIENKVLEQYRKEVANG